MVTESRVAGRIPESQRDRPEFAVIAHDIRKIYKDGEKEVEVLKGIDLEIRNGEIVSLMGPSGAGKSTLLHIIGLMETPSSGHLSILGWDAKSIGEKDKDQLRNKYIGFLFQFHYLLPELTLLENAALPAKILGLHEEEAQEKATLLLEAVGLKDRMSHLPSEVSGGEQQRAALARAMVNHPAILLCDEPTGNLDLERGEEVRDLIWRIARSQHSTVILTTHNPDVARSADRILKVVDGRLS